MLQREKAKKDSECWKRGLLEKAREAFTNMHEEHPVDMWSKKVPGRKNSKCKGPEVGM